MTGNQHYCTDDAGTRCDQSRLDMQALRTAIGRCFDCDSDLTQEELEARVNRVLEITRIGCEIVSKIEAQSETQVETHYSRMTDPDMQSALRELNAEIILYDRFVKVNERRQGETENGELKIRHQQQLDQARDDFSSFSKPQMDNSEILTLLAELKALNVMYRCLNPEIGKALERYKNRDYAYEEVDDKTFARRALYVAYSLNRYECKEELPPIIASISKEDDQSEDGVQNGKDKKQEALAMMVCILDRLGYLGEDAENKPAGFTLSKTEKRILLGVGAAGLTGWVLFTPHTLITKAFTGLAAMTLAVCATSMHYDKDK